MRVTDCLLSWRWWLGKRPVTLDGPPPKLSVTILIPAYNEEASIEKTIQSVLLQTYPIERIIVIDDFSHDRTGEIARSMGVTVIRTSSNQGTKARAENYGLSIVDTDLFVTVDADTVLTPTALEETLKYFNDPKTCAVCGFVIPQRIKTFWECGRTAEYIHGQLIFKSAQNHMGAIFVASGCFTVFRTALVRNFGGFSDRTRAEDMDLTWELSAAGYRVWYEPKAIAYPVDPPTFKIFVRQVDRWYRGFFQNVQVRRFRLFNSLNIGLALYVTYCLLLGILAPVGIIIGFATAGGISLLSLGAIIALNFALVWIPVILKGLHLKIGIAQILLGLVAFTVIRFLNLFLFYRALVEEWILGRTLSVWHKGH